MTDVIHKVLNDITVDEWAIIIGGDSQGCQGLFLSGPEQPCTTLYADYLPIQRSSFKGRYENLYGLM
jgi:hypothetical protein